MLLGGCSFDLKVLYSLADHKESIEGLVKLIDNLELSLAGSMQFKAAVQDIRNTTGQSKPT